MTDNATMAKVRHALGGWIFRCPGCDELHRYKDGKWSFNGDVNKPTFKPSLILTVSDCRCHSHVKDGKICFLSDCTHEHAGETMDLPDWDEDNL